MTDFSHFTILLSRQRSGTNALRSVLESHPEIFCFNEVFNFGDKDSDDPFLRHTNFFNFLKEYARGDLDRIFPDRHERLFLDFMEYLRCFASKPHIVIDVKYNTTHFFTKTWTDNMTAPYLLTLLRKLGLRVLNLRRRNYLRYSISNVKALQSRVYSLSSEQSDYHDGRVCLKLEGLLNELQKCRDEDRLLDAWFSDYPLFRPHEYVDVFRGSTSDVSVEFLATVAGWLGVTEDFRAQTDYRKQSYLPLTETIENYDEVANLLTGTEYEYCLEDEPMYRALSVTGQEHV